MNTNASPSHALLAVVACALFSSPAQAQNAKQHAKKEAAKENWEYLDNGDVRIGVDRSRGAAIGYFADAKTQRNLLNHNDEGRFIQQSYYGDKDGSMWNKTPWTYNPVQGGS